MKMITFLALLVVLQSGLAIVNANGTWPPDSPASCTQSTKQKAMYGRMTYLPSISSTNAFVQMSVKVKIDDLQFAPHNTLSRGGFYVSYTMGVHGGPGGYLGVQMTAKQGRFVFSIWDADRWDSAKQPKPSNKITWPMDMTRCKRNCQDCGMAHLRKFKADGLTTGTQCSLSYPDMEIGGEYEVVLKRVSDKTVINTNDYGGMPEAHKIFGEYDRDITGGVWEVKVEDIQKQKTMTVGKIMFEGDGRGMNRLGTFDEMLGCNKCNAVYHKNSRYGPAVTFEDGAVKNPIKMEGKTRAPDSSCKDYMITGDSSENRVTFEGGPLKQGSFPEDGKFHVIWKK